MSIQLRVDPQEVSPGDEVTLEVTPPSSGLLIYDWNLEAGALVEQGNDQLKARVHWKTNGMGFGTYSVQVDVWEVIGFWDVDRDGRPDRALLGSNPVGTASARIRVVAWKGDRVPVTLRRTASAATSDIPLWVVIDRTTEAMSFTHYAKWIDRILCKDQPTNVERAKLDSLKLRRSLPYNDADAYRILKVATEAYEMLNCGVALDPQEFDKLDSDLVVDRLDIGRMSARLDPLWQRYLERVNGNRTIPYLQLVREKLGDVRLKQSLFDDAQLPEDCYGILEEKLTKPCLLELIWSYWHEEGMLVQTMNAITRRFQNIRGPGDRDPLAMVEIDPLRPLNNLLWGYLQDEQHRLSIQRRAYEYDHHYGLSLEGQAVRPLRPADSRSKFVEAFHNLLSTCSDFFKQDDDTTVISDGFPVLNDLKEVHLLLTQGAHNQFGDLPSTARIEMLMEQWLLARPEFRDFLPARVMVAYPEPWMDRVDAMKDMQSWTDVSSMHFHNLGVFGEKVLLSIRYAAWNTINNPANAVNWARFWRSEIQGYIHAYRVVTGVDLSTEMVDARQAQARYLPPAVHLRARLALRRGARADARPAVGPGTLTPSAPTSRTPAALSRRRP